MKEMNPPDMGRYRDAACKAWRPPACPFAVETCSAVLDQVRREAEAGFHEPRGEHEIGGVLFGVSEPNCIRIVASRPLMCEHAMGPGFVLSEKDGKRLAQLISAPGTDLELNGLQALGWYHSHVRSRIFLSERDLQIHSRYFAAPHQVALVIHPGSEGRDRAGFFFREPSGEMRTESSYEEFILEARPPAAPELGQGLVSTQASSHRRTSAPRREAICPRCGSKHVRPSRRTGPIERLRGVFGFYPYRCHECLSRSFLKTSSDLLERARSRSQGRPEERRRARRRTRREILLWGGGVLGFLAILYFVIRDTGPRSDGP